MFLDDRDELLVPFIQYLWRDIRHIRLVQKKPIRMLALKNREVRIEEGAKSLKILVTRDFLLAVVGSVDQVVQNLLFDLLRTVVLCLQYDLLDLVHRRKAGPENEFEFSEHKQLSKVKETINLYALEGGLCDPWSDLNQKVKIAFQYIKELQATY